jgi:hypothetical protein
VIVDILVEVSITVSNEDPEVAVEVSYFGDVNDDVGYSFEFVISSIVLGMFVLAVLGML